MITVLSFLHIILFYYYSFNSFYTSDSRCFFYKSLSNSKSPQVSRTLRSILADLNNAVVWMVSTRPMISKSSSLCIRHLVTVPRTPITIDVTVIFMFHLLFVFSVLMRGPGTYLSFRLLTISLLGQPGKQRHQFGNCVCARASARVCVYYYYYYLFHEFFIGVCVTGCLLKSPGLFSVFCPFSTML